jgi:hypothetical protein
MTDDGDDLNLRAIRDRAADILDRDLPVLRDYISQLEGIVRDVAASRANYSDVLRCVLCGELTLNGGGLLRHQPGCPIIRARDLLGITK